MKPDNQDMSIFLYSVEFHCSCLLSDTALRFYLYIKLCIFEFRNLMTRIGAFSCTSSCLIVRVFFLILPYGFLLISSTASPNSDL